MTQMPIQPFQPLHSGRLVDVQGAVLPLERCHLEVDARGGLARVRLVQRFTNHHAEPLSVTYKLALPADAAVGGFSFRIGERRITGIVEGRHQARDRFERAVLEGKSAALLEQDRSSLFTQEIGNIPPGEAVEAEIDIDQPLIWLTEGCWEWRFPLAAAPRYLGAHDSSREGNVSVDVTTGDIGARASLKMVVRDAIVQGRAPESPSHPLVATRAAQATPFDIELGSGNRVQLDRDVVVRWPVAELAPGATIDAARPSTGDVAGSSYALVTVVPPVPEAKLQPVARDLTLLIDTSGSMSGEPLEQAKRVACALVDALGDGDQLEMIEFSNSPSSFKNAPEAATKALKKAAIAWIGSLQASGGTEMLSGVKHAMRELRSGSQRQIILITDGLVGFEREIVGTLLANLPATARLHALGVGSAVNRSLLAPIARAGRGTEAIVGLGEDPERASQRLLARTVSPVVVDLVVEGSAVRRAAPSRASDVFAGSPLRVAIELAPEGGEVTVRGRTANGAFSRQLRVPALERGAGSAAISKLFARELVEDLEMRLSSGENAASIDAEIERVGTQFAIATRLTSWVAVSEEATVDPRSPSRHETQPQALAYGMSAEGLGLRSPSFAPSSRATGARAPMMAGPMQPRMRSMNAPMPGMGGFGGLPPGAGAPPPPPAGRAAPPRQGIDVWSGRPGRADEADDEGGAPRRKAEETFRGYKAPPPRQAPPPPPAQAREKDSLFESAKKKIGDLFKPAAAEPPAPQSPPAAKPKPAAAPKQDLARDAKTRAPTRMTWRGRIARVEADIVIVEVVTPAEGVELSLASGTVVVTLADGSQIDAELVVERSTRDGSYGGSITLRLVARLPSSAAASLARIRFELPGSSLAVEAVQ